MGSVGGGSPEEEEEHTAGSGGAPPPPVVCVTGSTGYVGSWLVRTLLRRGYRVHATARDTGMHVLRHRNGVLPCYLPSNLMLLARCADC
jgi:prephenate dehydrogenase